MSSLHPIHRKFIYSLLLCLLVGLALVLLASPAKANLQALSLPWWTADSGGRSTANNYILYSAIGQPDAGGMSGGTFVLTGGFLAAPTGPPAAFKLFLPAIFKT
jgi:hypothetical protein